MVRTIGRLGRRSRSRASRSASIAIRGGEQRIGWGAIVACRAGPRRRLRGGHVRAPTTSSASIVWSALLAAALRYATPLIFAALGGVTSERAGVVNIGLEGMMLTGAFFGAWGADITSSWLGGIAHRAAAGALLGLVHAVFAVTLRADQIVSGTAINFLAIGITGLPVREDLRRRRARPTTCRRSPTSTCRSSGSRSSARRSRTSTC